MNLLSVKNLSIRDIKNNKYIINNINFDLRENTCLGIVGESGSGKSMLVKSILQLLNKDMEIDGSVVFKNINLLKSSKEEMRNIRGKRICMILQNPMSSFDPLYTIGYQMVETIRENTDLSKKDAILESLNILDEMSIHKPREAMKKYPHQFSGGMLQRCIIGLALYMKPDIIIADEPTTALDSINQKDIMDKFYNIKNENKTSIVFISHDLGIIENLSNNILVMKNGEFIEYGNTNEIFNNPKHEYTKYLVDTNKKITESFNEVIKIKEGSAS